MPSQAYLQISKKIIGIILAKMVLSNEKNQIENPSDLIIRNSL